MIQPVQDRHSHKLEDEICTFGQDCFSFFLSLWLINCQLSKQMQHNKCKAQNVMPAILLKCAQHALSTRKHVLKRGCKNTVRLLSSDVSYLTPSPLPTHAGKKNFKRPSCCRIILCEYYAYVAKCNWVTFGERAQSATPLLRGRNIYI